MPRFLGFNWHRWHRPQWRNRRSNRVGWGVWCVWKNWAWLCFDASLRQLKYVQGDISSRQLKRQRRDGTKPHFSQNPHPKSAMKEVRAQWCHLLTFLGHPYSNRPQNTSEAPPTWYTKNAMKKKTTGPQFQQSYPAVSLYRPEVSSEWLP